MAYARGLGNFHFIKLLRRRVLIPSSSQLFFVIKILDPFTDMAYTETAVKRKDGPEVHTEQPKKSKIGK